MEGKVIAEDEALEVAEAMEDEERRRLLGDKFAGLTPEQRLAVVEASLRKVGPELSNYRRMRMKSMIKKMKRQIKRGKIADRLISQRA